MSTSEAPPSFAIISGEQGSGRSARLAAVLSEAGDRVALLADPAGSWTGRDDLLGVVVVGPAALDGRSGSGLRALTILMASHPGAIVAVDDCELLPASRAEWGAFHAAARAAGCSLVLVSPPPLAGLDGSFRPSRGRARLLARPRPSRRSRDDGRG